MCTNEVEVDKGGDADVAKELLLHIDNLFHQRVNIFLVAEGIFLAAFAGLCAGQSDRFVKVVVCVVGLIWAVPLWYALYRLKRGFSWLAQVYKQRETTGLYEGYRHLGRGAPSANWLMAHLLPMVAVVMWVVLIIYSLTD